MWIIGMQQTALMVFPTDHKSKKTLPCHSALGPIWLACHWWYHATCPSVSLVPPWSLSHGDHYLWSSLPYLQAHFFAYSWDFTLKHFKITLGLHWQLYINTADPIEKIFFIFSQKLMQIQIILITLTHNDLYNFDKNTIIIHGTCIKNSMTYVYSNYTAFQIYTECIKYN